jgi:hypothetical protein
LNLGATLSFPCEGGAATATFGAQTFTGRVTGTKRYCLGIITCNTWEKSPVSDRSAAHSMSSLKWTAQL